MTDRVKSIEEEYKKRILRTTFGIGRQRRLNNPQLASRYSDAVLENWVPRQEIVPVDKDGNQISASAPSSDKKAPYYSNPEQDLDYIIYEDLYSYTVGGPILRELTKFIMGMGFKPKLIPKEDPDDGELIDKHKDVVMKLMEVDKQVGRTNEKGIGISFQDNVSRMILNSFTFNRSAALIDEGPVDIDGTEKTLPTNLRLIHPRDMGIIELDDKTWRLKAVQIRQFMDSRESGFTEVDKMIYYWNAVISAPAYNSDYYGISLMRNMYDELRALRRLISINFPTFADAVHTGIPVITINPEGTTASQRQQEGEDIVNNWQDGSPNVLFKDPSQTRVDNITFDPKITEFDELAQSLTKFAVMKAGLPQSHFFAENEANMATLKHRIQLAISVNINPIRAWIDRTFTDQWYAKIFKTLYEGSEEYKLFDIGVEFNDLQIETLEDRINTAVAIHNELAPLTPEGMGEYLQDPNFEGKIDLEQQQMMYEQKQAELDATKARPGMEGIKKKSAEGKTSRWGKSPEKRD